jgi:TonB family protein
VTTPTSLQDQIKSLRIDEATVRQLAVGSTDIAWPVVGGGPTSGRCAVYISADRTGRIREVWPQGCDHPGLQDPLRDIIKSWKLSPASEKGSPVQVEALVTFEFATRVVGGNAASKETPVQSPSPDVKPPSSKFDGPPVISPSVVRKAKPECSPGESCNGIHGEVTVKVVVLADGSVGDVTVRSGEPRLFEDAMKAARKCKFEPGKLFGKPTTMDIELKFQF